MPKAFTPKVVSANALLEGDVVYLSNDQSWTRDLSNAALFTDEADADIHLLQAQAQTGLVIGAYLADMIPGPRGPEPTHFREAFRRKGPSNYPHGKQEQI